MKNLFANASVFILFFGLLAAPDASFGQAAPRGETAQAAPRAADIPHRIAIVDMAQVFKGYKKFEQKREALKAEIQKSEETAKQMAEMIKKTQAELKEFQSGSPDYAKGEKKLVEYTTKFESYRKTQQLNFVRQEAAIYKEIYVDATEAIRRHAEALKYTLVLRYSGDDGDSPAETSNKPEDVMRNLNKQVVYHRDSDDLTKKVIVYLNRQLEPTASAPRSTQQQ